MRRSAMVAVIARELRAQDLSSYENARKPYKGYLDDAEALLKKIEEKGMIPRGEYVSSGCMHSMREMCSCGPGSYTNEWDKE